MKIQPKIVQKKGGPGFEFEARGLQFSIVFAGNPLNILKTAYIHYGGKTDFEEIYFTIKNGEKKKFPKEDVEAFADANKLVDIVMDLINKTTEDGNDVFQIYTKRIVQE